MASNVQKVARADVPDPPDLAVIAAVQDVKVLRPLEQFRLPHGPAVPRLPAAFEDGIGRILGHRCRVAGRRRRVAHGQAVLIRSRRLAGVDDVDRVAHHGDRGMGRAIQLIFVFCGNHRRPLDARPLPQITVADQQAGLLGRPLALAPIVHVVFAVGGVQEGKGILDARVVKALLRGHDDGVARVLRDIGEVVDGRRGVHDQPARAILAFAPDVVHGVIRPTMAWVAAAHCGGWRARIGLPFSIRLKPANTSNGIAFSRFIISIKY